MGGWICPPSTYQYLIQNINENQSNMRKALLIIKNDSGGVLIESGFECEPGAVLQIK